MLKFCFSDYEAQELRGVRIGRVGNMDIYEYLAPWKVFENMDLHMIHYVLYFRSHVLWSEECSCAEATRELKVLAEGFGN
jgi:hypothetical protein